MWFGKTGNYFWNYNKGNSTVTYNIDDAQQFRCPGKQNLLFDCPLLPLSASYGVSLPIHFIEQISIFPHVTVTDRFRVVSVSIWASSTSKRFVGRWMGSTERFVVWITCSVATQPEQKRTRSINFPLGMSVKMRLTVEALATVHRMDATRQSFCQKEQSDGKRNQGRWKSDTIHPALMGDCLRWSVSVHVGWQDAECMYFISFVH